ncbi:MAG: hypothetical protein QOD63_2685 [Actinomycetota bacterium]|nr:hypothetical protein [Actinomycetota bacterium]
METPAVPIALTGADQLVRTGIGTYYGFSIRETAGAVATVRIYDGTTAAGTLLDTLGLAANQSMREYYPDGIWVQSGIFVKIVAGAVEGSIRLG